MLEYYRFKVIHDLFLKGKAEDACIQLKELQKRYVDLCEENTLLKANAREYEDILFLACNFVFDGIFYWLVTGSIRQGPFCPICYKQGGQLVRITRTSPWRCGNCGEVFTKEADEDVQLQESGARALDQAAAVSSLRAIVVAEQFAQVNARLRCDKLALKDNAAPKLKAKIIPFIR